ncbi:hypothetical protein NUU61_005911 [Penicillium alfredii]|uniref:Uncharacterized protein n=1 Tax=Penicillium alfredii TaxID=1506179 RepID=A0A9W9K894_9EURO|nr:hypothetical protein NUU61_005911 [Penicillium alfredii]
MCGNRSPGGLRAHRHRWSLWIDGRWPQSTLRFPGGAAPREPPFVGVVRGVRSPHPRAVCRSLPASARAPGFRNTCVRTGTEGLCGGKWMVSLCPPRYAGGAAGAGRRRAPLPPSNYWPSPSAGVVSYACLKD